ncbi:MAG: PQQ-dependent sugar dehydrogenase [Actinomycetota bacterium]|nr:PQQ-dependent sugar dehydrogenase [Actinomycetota bacterium]
MTSISRRAQTQAIAGFLVLASCSQPAGSPGERGPDPAATSASTAAAPEATRLTLEEVATGFESPLQVTHAGDGSGRLFVVEQEGVVRTISPDGSVEPEAFLDLSGSIKSGGEQGLLGLAFHPDFETNGRTFVNYTDLRGDTVIAELRADPPTGRASPEEARVLLNVGQPYPNHNGGGLAFGPDGYLYIALGDGGSAGDPEENGQDLGSLLGKLLRIDVDHTDDGRGYAIPADNPFIGDGSARPEIWAYGLRNPWRFSFDDVSGTIWIGDVGQGELEEVDRAPVTEGGLNYGWNLMEGSRCFEPASGCDRTGLQLPITEYREGEDCSVTGGHVYRAESAPELGGLYLFADFCSGRIMAIEADTDGAQRPVELLDSDLAISSFGLDESGELYLTDLAGGSVWRIAGR